MGMGSKEFFTHLRDGEEYYNCMMRPETYHSIPQHLKDVIVLNEVRQKNDSFVNDELHKGLIKDVKKARERLLEYEHKVNHNTK
jgi:hypothetical protein